MRRLVYGKNLPDNKLFGGIRRECGKQQNLMDREDMLADFLGEDGFDKLLDILFAQFAEGHETMQRSVADWAAFKIKSMEDIIALVQSRSERKFKKPFGHKAFQFLQTLIFALQRSLKF